MSRRERPGGIPNSHLDFRSGQRLLRPETTSKDGGLSRKQGFDQLNNEVGQPRRVQGKTSIRIDPVADFCPWCLPGSGLFLGAKLSPVNFYVRTFFQVNALGGSGNGKPHGKHRQPIVPTMSLSRVCADVCRIFALTFLMSSRTVFMFSIQIASTGPSNTTHFLSDVGLEAANLHSRHMHDVAVVW